MLPEEVVKTLKSQTNLKLQPIRKFQMQVFKTEHTSPNRGFVLLDDRGYYLVFINKQIT